MSERLPFEPGKRSKKKGKVDQAKATPTTSASVPASPSVPARIPEAVNQRIVRRVALFCGIPTALGVLSFIGSYIVTVNHWFALPNTAVLLLTMACFGSGVLGLSYGAISASWDEHRDGTLWGWSEFQTNLGHLIAAWKAQRAERLAARPSHRDRED